MDIMNFGPEELDDGSLNGMLQDVDINDIGSFVRQFRNQANQEAKQAQQTSNFMAKGGSLLNQVTGGRGRHESPEMIQGAFNAYKMFSGGRSSSGGGGGGGGFLDKISSTYDNAQKTYALYKKFDKNGDGTITVEDIHIFLQEMGLGAVSPYIAKGLFQAVDKNNNGSLDFTDLMALTTIVIKLSSKFGTGAQ